MNVVYPFITDPVLSTRVRWVGEAVAEEPDRSYTGVTRQTHIPTYEQFWPSVHVSGWFLGVQVSLHFTHPVRFLLRQLGGGRHVCQRHPQQGVEQGNGEVRVHDP